MDLMERIFWGLTGFIGIHFIWLKWLEEYLSLYFGTVLAVVFLVGFVTKWWRYVAPRTKDQDSR